jgi:hypothetical protein
VIVDITQWVGEGRWKSSPNSLSAYYHYIFLMHARQRAFFVVTLQIIIKPAKDLSFCPVATGCDELATKPELPMVIAARERDRIARERLDRGRDHKLTDRTAWRPGHGVEGACMSDDYPKILTKVGDHLRLVDHDLFCDVHQALADQYRAMGLTGHLLDLAIVSNLPRRLSEVLDGTVATRH